MRCCWVLNGTVMTEIHAPDDARTSESQSCRVARVSLSLYWNHDDGAEKAMQTMVLQQLNPLQASKSIQSRDQPAN